jgi:hypothetical protein
VRVGSSIEITCVFAKGIGKNVQLYSCGDNVFITFVGTGVLELFQKNPSCYKNMVTGKLKFYVQYSVHNGSIYQDISTCFGHGTCPKHVENDKIGNKVL